ncbi:unannotated protein [freshwater metagenome]|uniref:Unannotated protein n=1 Tax=freshwater metagenome TaxID=449393 RepID=A0A6J6E096_9ZZZZ|nr:peptidoglycan DD-metalloendopeptidase family protein [Actinomycetota bacterium]
MPQGVLMLKLLTTFLLLIQAMTEPLKPPEIWATPIPDFDSQHSWDYYLPATEYGAGHRGIDLFVSPGQELRAPFDAVVSFSGKVVDRNLITLRSLTGYKASFEVVCTDLTEGDWVSEGQVFGQACKGDTGYHEHCQNCVHFSVRSPYGYLNPLLFVGKLKPSQLVS